MFSRAFGVLVSAVGCKDVRSCGLGQRSCVEESPLALRWGAQCGLIGRRVGLILDAWCWLAALAQVAAHSDCAVSALWCQEMPQGGPIAARYSLRKEQSGVRDGSYRDKSPGRRCVVGQRFDSVRRWRGPLLAFSASKTVVFCNRAPLRHFLTSPHGLRPARPSTHMTFESCDLRFTRLSAHVAFWSHVARSECRLSA